MGDDRKENIPFENDPHAGVNTSDMECYHVIE
jgi:hypothetical protein